MEIGKILNGTTMNNPLGVSIAPGHFSQISENNKKEDLKNILNGTSEFLSYQGKNSAKFPSKALVINLKEREDRWESFQKKNSYLFEKLEVSRFEAITDPDVRKGIFLSHLGCLEQSFPNEDCILVLEDDCELALGWYDKLLCAFSDLPEDWDVLIGNHYFFGQIVVLSDNIAQPIGRASTANFVLYKKSSLEKIKNEIYLRENGLQDIDHFLTDTVTSIKNYTVWPMLSREFLSFSDHHRKVRNMEFRVREHAFLFPYIDSEIYYPSLECW